MRPTFNVYEKNLGTEAVRLVEIFATREEAENWTEDMMSIWEDTRAYKIVEE